MSFAVDASVIHPWTEILSRKKSSVLRSDTARDEEIEGPSGDHKSSLKRVKVLFKRTNQLGRNHKVLHRRLTVTKCVQMTVLWPVTRREKLSKDLSGSAFLIII